MAKSKGPYFEFYIQKYAGSYEFAFAPGNSSKQVFDTTKVELVELFKGEYNQSYTDFIRNIELHDGTPSVAIYQTKALPVFRAILGSSKYRDFKLKVTGLTKDGETKEKILENPVQALEAREIIPYFNKNNNDLTTKRRK